MKTIKNILLLSIMFFVESNFGYCQTISYNNKCNSIVLKCDFYDKRTSIKEDSTNKAHYIYVSSLDCDSMNFIVAESEQPVIYRKDNIFLNSESTYLDTCFYMLYYIQENYLNKDKIRTSFPIKGGKIGKKKTFEFYHCTFNHIGIDWVARMDIYEGKIIQLKLNKEDYKISNSLIGYFIFTAIRDKQKWKLNSEAILN